MLYMKILLTERRKKMHLWGDEWFRQYGDDLNNAIKYVEQRTHKWARVGVCGKEKYGTYRDECNVLDIGFTVPLEKQIQNKLIETETAIQKELARKEQKEYETYLRLKEKFE